MACQDSKEQKKLIEKINTDQLVRTVKTDLADLQRLTPSNDTDDQISKFQTKLLALTNVMEKKYKKTITLQEPPTSTNGDSAGGGGAKADDHDAVDSDDNLDALDSDDNLDPEGLSELQTTISPLQPQTQESLLKATSEQPLPQASSGHLLQEGEDTGQPLESPDSGTAKQLLQVEKLLQVLPPSRRRFSTDQPPKSDNRETGRNLAGEFEEAATPTSERLGQNEVQALINAGISTAPLLTLEYLTPEEAEQVGASASTRQTPTP